MYRFLTMTIFVRTSNHIYPRLIGCLLLVLVALTSAPAFAQAGTADSDAVVVSPLSLIPVDDLNFGTLIPGASGGTAIISPTGIRTVTGSVERQEAQNFKVSEHETVLYISARCRAATPSTAWAAAVQ